MATGVPTFRCMQSGSNSQNKQLYGDFKGIEWHTVWVKWPDHEMVVPVL